MYSMKQTTRRGHNNTSPTKEAFIHANHAVTKFGKLKSDNNENTKYQGKGGTASNQPFDKAEYSTFAEVHW